MIVLCYEHIVRTDFFRIQDRKRGLKPAKVYVHSAMQSIVERTAGPQTNGSGDAEMIMTDPALIALRASVRSIERSHSRLPRLRFWLKRPAHSTFGQEAYYASQRVSFVDAEFPAATESGGPRVHAITRNAINGG